MHDPCARDDTQILCKPNYWLKKKLHGFAPAGFDPSPFLIFGSSFRVGCEGQGLRPGQVRHYSEG